jgi:hypothetical protein
VHLTHTTQHKPRTPLKIQACSRKDALAGKIDETRQGREQAKTLTYSVDWGIVAHALISARHLWALGADHDDALVKNAIRQRG